MKPNANLARQKISNEFSQSNTKFWDRVNFFNPETQIVSTFLYFKQFENTKLVRLIKWQGLTNKGAVVGTFYDRQELPFRCSLSLIVDGIYEANFQYYLKHSEKITDNLINYKIDEIQWFIKLGTVRDQFAPPFSSKWLNFGIRINKNENGLTVCFQAVSKAILSEVDHNLTKVIPITHENFERVLNWHAEEANKYLQESK